MLRRAGNFQKSNKAALAPLPEDTGEVLHWKWLAWTEQESRRRLAFYLFLYDAKTSMALLVNPLISYAEMILPLPESRELWQAVDAESWKEIYLKQQPRRHQELPTLVWLLQNPLELSSLEGYYDLQFSILIVLHGLWALVWEYTQFASILAQGHGHSKAASFLRHQDLCQAFTQLRTAIDGVPEAKSTEIFVLLELLSMYLQVSLDKIQVFAGKEGLDAARRVLPALQEWAEAPISRQAVWHAGQVLCTARRLPTYQLRGFNSIAVYHASLTCWAYGLICRMKSRAGASDQDHTTNGNVFLDGPMTLDAQRFISSGRGTPGISTMGPESSDSSLVPLSDSAALMKSALRILCRNSPLQPGDEAIPPLVQNLAQLIMDLGHAGASVADVAK